MISENIADHVDAYKKHEQIIDAAHYILRSYNLENDNLERFEYRNEELQPNYIVITTEGSFGEPQIIRLPKNFFNFDLSLAVNLLAHEMLHVRQKTQVPFVEDKNEREWQAYTENLFHENFPQVPDAPLFNQKQFAEKALEYYKRMGEGSELQQKYAEEKAKVENRLDEILIERGEKKPENNDTESV